MNVSAKNVEITEGTLIPQTLFFIILFTSIPAEDLAEYYFLTVPAEPQNKSRL